MAAAAKVEGATGAAKVEGAVVKAKAGEEGKGGGGGGAAGKGEGGGPAGHGGEGALDGLAWDQEAAVAGCVAQMECKVLTPEPHI